MKYFTILLNKRNDSNTHLRGCNCRIVLRRRLRDLFSQRENTATRIPLLRTGGRLDAGERGPRGMKASANRLRRLTLCKKYGHISTFTFMFSILFSHIQNKYICKSIFKRDQSVNPGSVNMHVPMCNLVVLLLFTPVHHRIFYFLNHIFHEEIQKDIFEI